MHQTFSQQSMGVTSEAETRCSLTSSGIIREHFELLKGPICKILQLGRMFKTITKAKLDDAVER